MFRWEHPRFCVTYWHFSGVSPNPSFGDKDATEATEENEDRGMKKREDHQCSF
jgi:hypothetical protein